MTVGISLRLKIAALAWAAVLTNCQTSTSPQPAVLVQTDDETMAQLKSALALAMGTSRVEIGAAELTKAPEIPVLPPRLGPFEAQSPAIPTIFELAIQNDDCLIIKRSTGEVFAVAGISCKPIAD